MYHAQIHIFLTNKQTLSICLLLEIVARKILILTTVSTIFSQIPVHDKKFYMDFTHILKPFASIPRKQIWQALAKRGIKKKLRNNIKAIYEVTRNYVRKETI